MPAKRGPGPAPGSGERIYESDIIRNATQPRTYVPAYTPPRLYESDIIKAATKPRTYVPAFGTQAAATVKLNSGIGGSGGGGVAAPAEPLFTPTAVDLSKNPIPGLYDALLAYTAQNAAARPAEFAATGEQFQKNRDASTQGLYDAYMGSRQSTDASAIALGADPAVISAARDLAMRKSQERSDQDLAASKDWLAKMGLLSEQQGQAYQNMYAGQKASESAKWIDLEQNRVNNLDMLRLQALVASAQAKAKGGGGGGKRGGGGSSGKASETATEEDVLAYGGQDLAVRNEILRQYGPEAAAKFDNTFRLTSGTAGQKAAQTSYNELAAKVIPKFPGGIVNDKPKADPHGPHRRVVRGPAYTAAKQTVKDKAIAGAILQGQDVISGNMGNPKTTRRIKRTAKGPK